VIDSVNPTLEKDKEYDIEHRIIWPDGTIRWVSEKGRAYRDIKDKAIRMVGIVQDITQRKLNEEEINKLTRAVKDNPTTIIITDKDGKITYVNPKFTEATGYRPDEVIGQTPGILKSGEHPPEFYKELWNTILKGKEWRGEFRNKRKNGELFWHTASIYPIYSSSGKITYFVSVQEDVTEKKKADIALKIVRSVTAHYLAELMTRCLYTI